MAANKPSLATVTGYFVGHIIGITFLFGIIAAAAGVLHWYVKQIEPLSIAIPYFIPILHGVAAFVFYGDVVLFIVGVLVAGGIYVRDLIRCCSRG
jgi:hypothetical protein